MALYCYVKSPPKPVRRLSSKKLGAVGSVLLLFLGLVFLSQAILPILGWYLFVLPNYDGGLVSPLATTFGVAVRAEEVDSYKPTNWFLGAAESRAVSRLTTYSLTIPRLGIDAATVQIGGDDLKKSLIAWPDSAPPGRFGNNIIFGHSELPQFANPKSYSGIFTFLMDLAVGDEILVDYDGVRYRYLVSDKKVVEPTDISVLEQRFDSAYVTLITCVPPGTLWKRGIVRAKLVRI